MVISNLNFYEQSSYVRDKIPLLQFNDTAEVIIDTLTIQNNLINYSDNKRILQSQNGSQSYMDLNNK